MADNPSGITPLDHTVLLLPDKTEEITKGGIIIPDQTKDRQQFAATTATLVAIGMNAFGDWGGLNARPKVSQTVLTAKYAGMRQKGADGVDYILCKDEELVAVYAAAEPTQ